MEGAGSPWGEGGTGNRRGKSRDPQAGNHSATQSPEGHTPLLSPPSGGRAQGLWDERRVGQVLRASWGFAVGIPVRARRCLGEFVGKLTCSYALKTQNCTGEPLQHAFRGQTKNQACVLPGESFCLQPDFLGPSLCCLHAGGCPLSVLRKAKVAQDNPPLLLA